MNTRIATAGPVLLALVCALTATLLCGCRRPAATYGANPAAGKTFVHDGFQLYYETYGAGEPLLLVHMNGGSIGTFKAQIDQFRSRYRVIAMDSRDHGKSAASPGKLSTNASPCLAQVAPWNIASWPLPLVSRATWP